MSVNTSVTDQSLPFSDNTTNDVSTTKHGFVPKAPNDTTKFLRGDATWAVPAGGSSAVTMVATVFEGAGRFTVADSGGGASTFGTNGLAQVTAKTATDRTRTTMLLSNRSTYQAYARNPKMTFGLAVNALPDDNFQMSFVGLADSSLVDGMTGAFDFTIEHLGVKLVRTGGVNKLQATVATGGVETATDLISGIANGDFVEVIIDVVTSGSSINFYTRLNDAAQSAAVNVTTNIPNASTCLRFMAEVGNDNVGTSGVGQGVEFFSYSR